MIDFDEGITTNLDEDLVKKQINVIANYVSLNDNSNHSHYLNLY